MALKIIYCFSRFFDILKRLAIPIVLSLLLRLAPSLDYFGLKARVKFVGKCFKQDKVRFIHKRIEYLHFFNSFVAYQTR